MYRKVPFVVVTIALIFSATPVHASSHAKSLSNLRANDLMFAQLMIPHHQQAIDMSNLALKNNASLSVKVLARDVISAQKKEIAQMKYWLTSAKASSMMDHSMEMGGMLNESEMKTLKSLKGTRFSKAFLEAMIKHHLGALEMVKYLNGAKNPEAKALGMSIKAAQSGEISIMKKMLSKLG